MCESDEEVLMQDEALPCFIDFEASSLSFDSYPIEIAWSDARGEIESHLIDPSGVADWTEWSEESERIHTIPRGTLLREGKSPAFVCERLRTVATPVLFTDAARFDDYWLNRLVEAVDDCRLPFVLEDAHALYIEDLYPVHQMQTTAVLEELKQEARRSVGGQHRATWDVQYLLTLYRLVRAYISADGAGWK